MDNIQLYPSKIRVELNDKATKILFNLTPERFNQMLQQMSKQGVIEKRNHKKHGKIRSTFQIFNENGYTLLLALDEFDRAVLAVCISEWDAGNRYITIPMIQRGLTGKIGKHDFKVYLDQETAIKQSIDKLMATQYDPDIVDAFEKLNYTDENGVVEKISKSPILPCQRVEKFVNGQKVDDIVHFLCESPLHKVADLKNQILRYDVELLDVPNLRNTPLVIMLKNYTMRRVVECKQHKMTPTVTIDDIFSKCRITDAAKSTKSNARDTLEKLFAHLQSKGFIKSYQWNKKHTKIYSISFTF